MRKGTRKKNTKNTSAKFSERLPVILSVFVSECEQVGRPPGAVTHHHGHRRDIRDTLQYRPDCVRSTLQNQTHHRRAVTLAAAPCTMKANPTKLTTDHF